MAVFTDDASLNKYVAPILLESIQVLDDNFTQYFGKVSAGARSADGVNINLIVNDFQFETGVSVDDTFGEPEKVADKKAIVPWTNFTSKVYRVSDTDIRKLTYNKETAIKGSIVKSLNAKLATDALHAVAPTSDASETPVIQTTGEDRGDGSKAMTKKDVLKLKERYDGRNFVLVLCKQHQIDLLADELASSEKTVLTNLKDGEVRRILGIDMAVNERLDIKYTAAAVKKLIGADPAAGDKHASIVVEEANSMFDKYSLGIQYQGKDKDFTYKVPHSRLRIYGEFIGEQIQDDKMRGAVIDGAV